jgi:cysteine desulfurase/selenocysteine lyase
MDLSALRADFPYLEEPGPAGPLVYLDNAATTQRPRQLLETLSLVYARYNANIHRSPHRLGQAATDLYEQAHASVARFIGARSAAEIVFVRNTTEAPAGTCVSAPGTRS